MAARPPHFAAKARAVVFLFMDGGPSQVDTFDPKPRLDREHGQPIQVTPPNHVVYKVVQCEPAARGNTATGLTKPVTLETGAVIVVPAFVEEGTLLKIDTRTGEYRRRV